MPRFVLFASAAHGSVFAFPEELVLPELELDELLVLDELELLEPASAGVGLASEPHAATVNAVTASVTMEGRA